VRLQFQHKSGMLGDEIVYCDESRTFVERLEDR
jgi:hypothetical protein